MEAIRTRLAAAAGADGAFVEVVAQKRAGSAAEVASFFEQISGLGGEGVMVRQPGSLYANTRSNTLLKIKKMEDLDAKVIGYDSGGGKFLGRVGALIATLPNGKQFKVGSGLTDAQRSSPPAVGTIIVVRYQELTDGGVPRFPTFAGVRADGVWPPAK
jgi:DNA ligase-1